MANLYLRYEHALAAIQLALAMAGLGATLGFGDFLAVIRRPVPLFAGLLLQLAVMPVLAVVLGGALGLAPGLATGLALVAAVPGGVTSNLFTHLGRGHTALSISLTALTTLACLATTPILLGLTAAAHLPPGFTMPTGRIMGEIFLALLLPLAIGMATGHLLPRARERVSAWCIRGSLSVIGLIVIGSASAGRVDPREHGAVALLAIFALPLAAQAGAQLLARGFGLSGRDVLALAMNVTIRNVNLALLIAASLFPAAKADPLGDGVFFVALLYGGFAFLVATPPMLVARRVLERPC